MSVMATEEVQRALFNTLTADAILMDTLTGVYDHIPPNASYPYLVISAIDEQDVANDDALGSALQVTLNIYQKAEGRKAVLAILKRLHALLHHGSMSVNQGRIAHMRVSNVSTVLYDQEDLVQGSMTLQLLFSR